VRRLVARVQALDFSYRRLETGARSPATACSAVSNPIGSGPPPSFDFTEERTRVFSFQGEEFLTIRWSMEDEPADCTARVKEFVNRLARVIGWPLVPTDGA
jgi:hypothetical protein